MVPKLKARFYDIYVYTDGQLMAKTSKTNKYIFVIISNKTGVALR